MKWQEAQTLFPNQWILVSPIVIQDVGEVEIWDEIAIVETFPSSSKAMLAWYHYQRANSGQISIPVSTVRDQINIHKIPRGMRFRIKS